MSPQARAGGDVWGPRADDVLAAMIAYFSKGNIPASPLKIHKVIYNLRTRYKDLLGEFLFPSNTRDPFSKRLERALFGLEIAGLLGTLNPTFEIYQITEEAKRQSRAIFLTKFDSKTQKKIKALARDFETALCA